MINNFSWSSKEEIFKGIWLYKDVFKPEHDFINKVENFANSNNINWMDGKVGYGKKISNYRDCVDIKFGPIENPRSQVEKDYDQIWKDAYNAQLPAVEDYCAMYSIRMEFWEMLNFIKYTSGQHFNEHSDDGFSYRATVSLVGYPNDDYEGGELTFPKFNISIKPQAGDLYIFPSTYIFSHVAEPVISGIKYSIVTMLDYNDHAHNEEYYSLRDRLMNKNNV